MHCPKCLTNDLTWISQLWNKSKKYNLFVNIEIVNSQIDAIQNLSCRFHWGFSMEVYSHGGKIIACMYIRLQILMNKLPNKNRNISRLDWNSETT